MQSQGWEDSYTVLDTLLLKGGEYAAKYNLGHDVPFDLSFYRCEAILVNGPWAQPSEIKRGIAGSPKVWDVSGLIYLSGHLSIGHGKASVYDAGLSCFCTGLCPELT